jgi:hypothetical protein
MDIVNDTQQTETKKIMTYNKRAESRKSYWANILYTCNEEYHMYNLNLNHCFSTHCVLYNPFKRNTQICYDQRPTVIVANQLSKSLSI